LESEFQRLRFDALSRNLRAQKRHIATGEPSLKSQNGEILSRQSMKQTKSQHSDKNHEW